MKITVCGSIAFFKEMQRIKNELESLGYEVKMPPSELKDDNGKDISIEEYYKLRKASTNDESWIWNRKEEMMRMHFDKVLWSDAVLILNYDKNNIKGYIGANTFLEMGLAMHLKKKIYLLKPIPEVSCKEEILGMKPIIINNNLSEIS